MVIWFVKNKLRPDIFLIFSKTVLLIMFKKFRLYSIFSEDLLSPDKKKWNSPLWKSSLENYKLFCNRDVVLFLKF